MDKQVAISLKYLPYLVLEDDKVIEVSHALYGLTKFKAEDLLGKSLEEVTKILNMLLGDTAILQSGTTCFIITKSHDVREVDIYIQDEAEGGRKIYLFIESPNSRLAEGFEKEKLSSIINTLHLPLFRVSYPDLCLIELNRKAFEELGNIDNYPIIDSSRLRIGESIFNISELFKVDKSYQCIREMLVSKKSVSLNNLEVVKDGTSSYINIIYQPVIGSNEKIEEFLMIIVDVTPEVLAKKEIENVLKLKEEFFSFISHEFKTPLTVINAAVQAIEVICKNEISARLKTYLNKIRQNSFRQLRLVNSLLDITKAEAGYINLQKTNMDIVSLTKEILDSVALYAKQREVGLEFYSSISEKVIGIDDEKYERIILNLLSNAIKFTPSGKNIYVILSCKRQKICIEVKDEGIGIPTEMQSIIFEPFKQVNNSLTRQADGTGIGLSLVKKLIEVMEGEILLESKVGKGSSFTIILPSAKVSEKILENQLSMNVDGRLLRAVAIEFSHIYAPEEKSVN